MRTTLALADDAFLVARECAARERVTLGEAISRLVRDGFRSRAQVPQVSAAPLKGRYSLLPMRDEIITDEHVRRLMDEEGI